MSSVKKSLISLALGGLGIGTTEFTMMGLLPDVASDFQISIPQAGHLISAYALGVVIGAPLLVLLGSAYPPKKILMFLMGIFTVFNGLTALAPNYEFMLLGRLLSGLPHGAFFGVGSVVASRLADKGKEASAISIMFAGLTVANLLMVPIGTYIGHNLSWRITFGIIGVIGLITLISVKSWMPEIEARAARSVRKELSLFKRYDAWLLIFITSVGTGGLFAWISYIAPMMIHVTRFSEQAVSYIMVVAGCGMFVGNLIGGKLADRLSPALSCIFSMVAIVFCLLINYFVAADQILMLVMTFVTGAVTFTLGTPIQILMIRTARESEMLGAAVSQASFNIGNALGAFLGGLPIAAGFGLASPLLVGVIMAAAGVALTFALIRFQKKNPSEQRAENVRVVVH